MHHRTPQEVLPTSGHHTVKLLSPLQEGQWNNNINVMCNITWNIMSNSIFTFQYNLQYHFNNIRCSNYDTIYNTTLYYFSKSLYIAHYPFYFGFIVVDLFSPNVSKFAFPIVIFLAPWSPERLMIFSKCLTMTIVRILVAYLNETYSFPENISKKKRKRFSSTWTN